MTAEQRLAAFLSEDQAPRQDPVFSARVMRRVARRELAVRLMSSAVLAAAAAAALWAMGPSLSVVIEPVARTLAPAAVVLTLTAAFVMFSQGLAAGRVRR